MKYIFNFLFFLFYSTLSFGLPNELDPQCFRALELKPTDKAVIPAVLDVTQNPAFSVAVRKQFIYSGELTRIISTSDGKSQVSILESPGFAAKKLVDQLIDLYGKSQLSPDAQRALESQFSTLLSQKQARQQAQEILNFARPLAQDENYRRAVENVLAVWLINGAEAIFLERRADSVTRKFKYLEPGEGENFGSAQLLVGLISFIPLIPALATGHLGWAGFVAFVIAPSPTHLTTSRWAYRKLSAAFEREQIFRLARKQRKMARNDLANAFAKSKDPVVVSVEKPAPVSAFLEVQKALDEIPLDRRIDELKPELSELTHKGVARFDSGLRSAADHLSLEVLRFAERTSVLRYARLHDELAEILASPIKPKRLQVAGKLGESLAAITDEWAQILDDGIVMQSQIKKLQAKLTEFEQYLAGVSPSGVSAALKEEIEGKALVLKLTHEQLQNSLAQLEKMSLEVSKRSRLLQNSQRVLLSRAETELDAESLAILTNLKRSLETQSMLASATP